VPGDASTSVANVLADAGLIQVGVIRLLHATVSIFLAVTLALCGPERGEHPESTRALAV
jgi:hypothetical protein